jgi:ATP-dependent helicase HrpB
MLVPPAILDDLSSEESVLLLQPRRLAARSVASQLAQLRQGRLGGEVGYQVRFDTKVSQETRLFVQTTGVLLRRLLDDVSLETVGGVILDEFHERTTEMDLILGMLIRLRQTVRPDLRILVMSATLETEPVAARLGGAAVITATGRPFPVDVRYLKRGRSPTHPRDLPAAVERTISDALRSTDGHVLVFLPGVGEIHATARLIEPIARAAGHRVSPVRCR